MATMNISLPDEMKDFVEARVASGLYSNSSDFVRDLIRRDMDSLAELRRLIQDGLDSGFSERTVEQIFEETKAELLKTKQVDAA